MIFAIFLPGLIALAALAGAIALAGQLGKVSTVGKVVLWTVIVLLGLLAFGIGTCYVMVFTGSGSFR
jgi:hypothetical protein